MGKGTYFPGLIPMIFGYLDTTGCEPDAKARISEYLRFVAARATGRCRHYCFCKLMVAVERVAFSNLTSISACVRIAGQLMTCAKWMRLFVKNHDDYEHDSVVTHKIAHDLMQVTSSHGGFDLRFATWHSFYRHATLSGREICSYQSFSVTSISGS